MMSDLLTRSHERRLLRASCVYRKGRTHVIWRYGVLYFGGVLFCLFAGAGWFFKPQGMGVPIASCSIAGILLICGFAGYLRGMLVWRGLDRVFSAETATGSVPAHNAVE